MSRKSSRPFRVGRAKTGLGLFATEAIRKGQTIVEYRGRRITTAEANEIERKGNNRYLFEFNKHWTIDGSSRRNLGRYLNHACKPNAEAITRRTGKLEIAASRWIEPGEEITIDYGEDYFDTILAETGCRCMTCAAKTLRKTAKVGKDKAAKKAKKKTKKKAKKAAKKKARKKTRKTR
jgi:hypothetical protein